VRTLLPIGLVAAAHRFVEHDRAGRPPRVHLRGTESKPMRSVILAMTLGLACGTLAGSASAAPDTPITDAKNLAGEWRAVGGTSPAGKVALLALSGLVLGFSHPPRFGPIACGALLVAAAWIESAGARWRSAPRPA
jgi:hypothetical protein